MYKRQVYIDKNDNNDWCLNLKPNNGNSTNYGILIEAENATSQAFVIRNSDDSNNNQFHINGEGDYFTGNSYPRTDANKDLGFRSGYRWRDLIVSGGVRFGSANAQDYLDDYEEGSWTPQVKGTTGAGTATYNNQVGRYLKIGNFVYINFPSLGWSISLKKFVSFKCSSSKSSGGSFIFIDGISFFLSFFMRPL